MGPEPREIKPTRALVPIQKSVIEWDADGNPVLAAQPALNPKQIQEAYFIVAAQPFVCGDPLSPDFGKYDGMTIAEVLVRKELEAAAGQGDANGIAAIEIVMNRLIGPPMTRSRNENVNVAASYEDVLKSIAEKAKGAVAQRDSLFGDLE